MKTLQVDARRLLCPMPVIRLQDSIEPLPVGTEVKIVCTDPGVINDIPAWCRINGHSILKINQQDDEFHITVRKDNDD